MKRLRKDGCWQRMPRELLMKRQAVRIVSTRQEEVFVAVGSNLGTVVGAEGASESIPGKEGRIAQAWVTVSGGSRVFSVYFWHSEGWTPRNEVLLEAVLKQEQPDARG